MVQVPALPKSQSLVSSTNKHVYKQKSNSYLLLIHIDQLSNNQETIMVPELAEGWAMRDLVPPTLALILASSALLPVQVPDYKKQKQQFPVAFNDMGDEGLEPPTSCL